MRLAGEARTSELETTQKPRHMACKAVSSMRAQLVSERQSGRE